jgi:hypothetical protein
MFLTCEIVFVALGWIAVWITSRSLYSMVGEVNVKRLVSTRIDSAWWHADKFFRVWQLHKLVAPTSHLRTMYVRGCSVGLVGFVIGLLGFFGTALDKH